MHPVLRSVLIFIGIGLVVIAGIVVTLFLMGLSAGAIQRAWFWGLNTPGTPANCMVCPAPAPAAQFYCCQLQPQPAPQVIFRQPLWPRLKPWWID